MFIFLYSETTFAFCKLHGIYITFYLAYNHFVVQLLLYEFCVRNRSLIFKEDLVGYIIYILQ